MTRTAHVAGMSVKIDPHRRARRLRIVRRAGRPTRLDAKMHLRAKRTWPLGDPAFWLGLGHGGV
ncbi:MAG TPA: hypothetical protein VEZ44_12355 [bacterium]|nr:hypothetical protein [bacterium]